MQDSVNNGFTEAKYIFSVCRLSLLPLPPLNAKRYAFDKNSFTATCIFVKLLLISEIRRTLFGRQPQRFVFLKKLLWNKTRVSFSLFLTTKWFIVLPWSSKISAQKQSASSFCCKFTTFVPPYFISLHHLNGPISWNLYIRKISDPVTCYHSKL